MMFRLETLLRVRKNQEDEELKRFGLVNAHLVQQKESLDVVRSLDQRNAKKLDSERNRNPDPSLFWLYDNFFQGLRIQEKRSNQIISEVSEKLRVCQKSLAEAMRKRKTLEILKDRANEAYQKKLFKRELDQLDEVASNLWRRRFRQ